MEFVLTDKIKRQMEQKGFTGIIIGKTTKTC